MKNCLNVNPDIYTHYKGLDESTNCKSHVFTMASKRANGTFIYVRFCNSDRKSTLNLVTSRTTPSSVQDITLQRLESLAAVIVLVARFFHHILLANYRQAD